MTYVFVATFQKVCNYKLFIASWGGCVIVPRNLALNSTLPLVFLLILS